MQKRVMILLAFFVLLFSGCAEKQEAIVNSSSNQLTPTEMPAEVKSLLDQHTAPDGVDLPEIVAAPPNFDFSSINDSIYDVYMVGFLWGHLVPFGPPSSIPLDWTGSLSINGPSFVKVITPVDFERGQDSLVSDSQPSAVHWVSYTDGRFDGIICLVLYDKVTPTLVPQVMTFGTPPINLTFDFSQLERFYAFYQVDPFNSVAVTARKIRLHHCREGFFKGFWQKSDSSDFRGFIRGHWFNKIGDTLGVVNGHFWRNENGVGKLEGNISGLYTNQIIANLDGFWIYDDFRMCPLCGTGHGQMRGHFQTVNGNEHGYFRGEFGDFDLPPGQRTMPLRGHWQLDCMNSPSSDIPNNF